MFGCHDVLMYWTDFTQNIHQPSHPTQLPKTDTQNGRQMHLQKMVANSSLGGVVLIEFDNYRSNIMKTRISGQSFGDILGECENEKIGQYMLCKGAALQRSSCE